jgi:dynein heavy chain, axonemal
MDVMPKDLDAKDPPPKGCYIRGLFLDGGRWDNEKSALADSLPKVLFCELPIIWLKPADVEKDETRYDKIYTCPVYKTSERRGTLSTSGHSTNFVMFMYLPVNVNAGHSEHFWVRRGLAALTQVDD